MKALILNSGMGSRMGSLTEEKNKCLTELVDGETILSRQLKLLMQNGINEIVITTGPFEQKIIDHCDSLNLPIKITFVNNPKYKETNYIYSIYCAKEYCDDDILLLHGDLVFDDCVINALLKKEESSMVVSSTTPLPQKDFKAVIINNKIVEIGIDCFENALAAQPLYKLNRGDWQLWLNKIIEFCEDGNVNVYAENAFNDLKGAMGLYPFDVKQKLCNEIDTVEDLEKINALLKAEG